MGKVVAPKVSASQPMFTGRNVITDMSRRDIETIVASAKGNHLKAMLDAAQDVAEQSEWAGFRRTAVTIIAAAQQYHPEYFDPTLRGV